MVAALNRVLAAQLLEPCFLEALFEAHEHIFFADYLPPKQKQLLAVILFALLQLLLRRLALFAVVLQDALAV